MHMGILQRIYGVRTLTSNCIHANLHNVIANPCPNFNSGRCGETAVEGMDVNTNLHQGKAGLANLCL